MESTTRGMYTPAQGHGQQRHAARNPSLLLALGPPALAAFTPDWLEASFHCAFDSASPGLYARPTYLKSAHTAKHPPPTDARNEGLDANASGIMTRF